MNLPILYHKGKNGELRQWRTWTEGSDVLTQHGCVGGQLQTSRKTAEAKSVGRSNETSPIEQATLESKSLWTYKLDRKYSETPEAAQEQLPLPMLAHSFKGTKQKKAIYPAHTQPKLDGVRCLAQRASDGIISLTSRQGKPWNIPHIQKQLDWLPEGMVLDGEIYIHGMSCQKITSWVKKWRPGESNQLLYHVYDMPTVEHDDSLTWIDRSARLSQYLQESDNVTRVEHTLIVSEKEVWQVHGSYIAEGYEGAIYRGFNGQYLWGYRSADLLKVKQFQDAEFTVLSARDGKGKMAGCVIWTCRNDLTDGTFECTMKVTMAERRRMYNERADYIGKQLTVRFFDRTDDNLPRFPVGIVFRDAKDLPS